MHLITSQLYTCYANKVNAMLHFIPFGIYLYTIFCFVWISQLVYLLTIVFFYLYQHYSCSVNLCPGPLCCPPARVGSMHPCMEPYHGHLWIYSIPLFAPARYSGSSDSLTWCPLFRVGGAWALDVTAPIDEVASHAAAPGE